MPSAFLSIHAGFVPDSVVVSLKATTPAAFSTRQRDCINR
jgi:hypothetical protein